MEYQEWRNQHQFDEHQSAKLPKMVQYSTVSASPGMGSLFSMAQWQELELQAQIYPYVMAEASVPLDLILSLKRSIVSSSPCNFCHHLQPSMVQTGYSGRYLVDPELGRCRRTDGKKWRCSREVVPGHKYCDRHVHRGRNRSRKHVEIHPTTAGNKKGYPSPMKGKKETRFTQPGQSPPLNIMPLNQRPSDDKTIDGCLLGKGSGSQVLMKFFDDWPTTKQESTSSSSSNATILPISTPDNSSSDISLKLSTGNGDWLRFENSGEASSIGGPLAEALRSSISPTSVLENVNGSACSDTSLC